MGFMRHHLSLRSRLLLMLILVVLASFILFACHLNNNAFLKLIYLKGCIAEMSEIEDILGRIKSHKSVQGYIITNHKGEIIRTTYSGEREKEGEKIIRNIPELVYKTQVTVKNLEKNNELQFMRIKTKFYEILIAPDQEFILIVVQAQFGKTEKGAEDN